MSHKLKHSIIIFLVSLLIIGSVPVFAAAEKETLAPAPNYIDLPVSIETVKVGLCFGDTALFEADIAAADGKGFLFGFFDASRRFNELGKSSVSSITVRDDTGFTLSDGTYVGPWRIILDKKFSDFDSAKSYSKDYWGGYPAYIKGEYRVLVGAYKNKERASSAIAKRGLSGEAFLGSDTAILAAETGTSELQFFYDMGEKTALAVKPISESAKPKTWFNADAYLGAMSFHREKSGLCVVNYVPLEDYVKCVLPYEMNASWPSEALKAQGLCARNYAINNVDSYHELGFDLRNDTYSQVYRGTTGTVSLSDDAAKASQGSFIRYKGAVCKVYYMSSDGGATDSSASVFSQRRAYLTGTNDETEGLLDFYNKTWRAELFDSTVLRRLNRQGFELKDIAKIVPRRENKKVISSLEITDSEGKTARLFGEDCFRALGLNSLNFKIDRTEAYDGSTIWVFSGKGWGHNCGMSQWGAYSLAKNKDASCEDIIAFYFSNAYVG